MAIARRRHHVSLLAVTAALIMALSGCVDSASNEDSLPSAEPTPTLSESLEGHATETDDQPEQADAGSIDLAPEIQSADAWYNTEPLTLEELRGHPVLLVFWATY